MTLEKISNITGKAIFVPGDDIDTDRIIPARFMKCVTFDGLGEYLFCMVERTKRLVPFKAIMVGTPNSHFLL